MSSTIFKYSDDFVEYQDEVVGEITQIDNFGEQQQQEEAEGGACTSKSLQDDQENGANRISLKIAITKKQLIIQRRNQSGTYIVFTIDKKYTKNFLQNITTMQEQAVNTYELFM